MTSIEDSMSSGSRLRQFGLYRTIDARTEEFLRLSRKRQIRQGCACAAASTAITVTVVIVVFFVYEFSLNSNTQLEKSLKYNWLSLINDTEDGTSFDPKVTKANIDKTTLKLLPLLLKAIKKNAALEKLFNDDQSNVNTQNDGKHTKEHENSKEQNSNTNDWWKKPTTHLLAVDHRTVPVIFYRDPTKNIELYTKIRKIRDYQRVFKYVDKMINDKVYVRSTKPMEPDTTYQAITTPKLEIKNKTKSHSINDNKAVQTKNVPNEEQKYTCQCSYHLKELLKKILANFEKILPEIRKHNNKAHSGCHKHAKNVTTTKRNSNYFLTRAPTYTSSERSIQNVAVPYETSSSEYAADEFEIYDSKPKKTTYVPDLNNKLSLSDLRYIKEIINTQPIQPKVLDKFNKLINKKQVLKQKKMKLSSKIVPVFEDDEYDEYGEYDMYTTPMVEKTANPNIMKSVKNKFNYLKDTYITNSKSKGILQTKSYTVPITKKKADLDTNIMDNKMTSLKSKHKIRSKNRNENGIINKMNNRNKSNLNLEITHSMNAEKQIISNLFNPSTIIEKYFENDVLKSSITDVPVLLYGKKDQNSPMSSYFKYSTSAQEEKTMYDILKNSVHSYLTSKTAKSNLISHTTPSLNKNNHQFYETTLKPVNSDNNNNKSATYRIIEDHVNTLLHKNISTLKAIKEKYYNVVPTAKRDITESTANMTSSIIKNYELGITKQPDIWSKFHETSFQKTRFTKPRSTAIVQNSNTKTELSEVTTQTSNEFVDENSDFLITEITRSPENAIYRPRFNLTEKKKDPDLTWEDLTNEFIPAWRSMVQDPNKPIYFGFQRTDDKMEEQEDYNINSNFYDLNL